jgi:hypothetical protein
LEHGLELVGVTQLGTDLHPLEELLRRRRIVGISSSLVGKRMEEGCKRNSANARLAERASRVSVRLPSCSSDVRIAEYGCR